MRARRAVVGYGLTAVGVGLTVAAALGLASATGLHPARVLLIAPGALAAWYGGGGAGPPAAPAGGGGGGAPGGAAGRGGVEGANRRGRPRPHRCERPGPPVLGARGRPGAGRALDLARRHRAARGRDGPGADRRDAEDGPARVARDRQRT